MAIVTITELREMAFTGQGNSIPAPKVPGVGEQSVQIPGQSDPFADTTRYIMVNCDSACCLAFGPEPVARAGFHRMGSGETRYYDVTPGDSLAVVASST